MGGGGVSEIIMHERVGERLRATAACACSVSVAARRTSATGRMERLTPPKARPTPRTLSAHARLHAPLERGVIACDGDDDLNVAS